MIDACVHPVVPRADDINAYLPREHRMQRLSPPLAGVYPIPIDDYIPGSVPTGDDAGTQSNADAPPPVGVAGMSAPSSLLPGSDPALLREQVLEDPGMRHAVLVPLTRGLVGDPRFESAIDAATNEWLAEVWLGEGNADGRLKGSIRVCPRSPGDAVKEIERWADHPHFVQVAVPLEAQVTYGEQMYYDVWKAAAANGLPVAVHSDHSGGALSPPTPIGYPTYALEAYSLCAMLGVTHLASLLGHGVFDRLKSLTFVFADGGFDYMQTLMWRLDKDWRSSRAEVPWMTREPSEYLREHVRYVVHRSDGAADSDQLARFIELNELGEVLVYGSNYPHWDYLPAEDFAALLSDDVRPLVMGRNAERLYGLQPVPDAGRE